MLNERLDIGGAGHVGAAKIGLAAQARDLLDNRLALPAIAIADNHRRPGAGQRQRGRPADARPAAGDQGHFVLEVHGDPPCAWLIPLSNAPPSRSSCYLVNVVGCRFVFSTSLTEESGLPT